MNKDELVQAVEDFKNGDEGKFEDIYLETNGRLYNYIFSLSDSLNNEDCYEILQETYILVNNKIDTLKECKAFNSWLCTIARNRTLRYLEKKQKEVLLTDEGQSILEGKRDEDEDFLPDKLIDNKEKQRMILEILDSLPVEQKEVVMLRYYDGLSVKEIASKLNISDGTVKSRLNYARKKIETGVLDLEKKGTKLYSTALPIILLLLRDALRNKNIGSVSRQVMEENISDITEGYKEAIKNNLGNSNIASKSGQGIKTATYTKLLLAGAATISLAIGARFLYADKPLDNPQNQSEEINQDSPYDDTTMDTKEEVRWEIDDYATEVGYLYEIVEYNNLFGENGALLWDIDEFTNSIELVADPDGEFYSTTYPNWALDWFPSFLRDVEKLVEDKKAILSLDNLNDKEKKLLKECDDKLKDFVKLQGRLDGLNEKLKDVAAHNGSQTSKKSAIEFNEKFEIYKDLLKNF